MLTDDGANMRNQLVYDLPMRIFHWLFAGLFVAAFFIAKTIDDDSPSFSYHMLAGLILGFIVVLRVIWGVVGTRYSRLASFALHPKDLVGYFKGILAGDKRKWAGHNPASSWAAIIMFILTLGLGLTGYLMASGQKEAYEDIHELLANGFLVVVLLHVAGVALHTLRHQDSLALSMVDGTKKDIPATEGISRSRPAVALLFLGLVATFAVHLSRNFDPQQRTLNLFGTTLQLGESEGDDGDQEEDEDDDD